MTDQDSGPQPPEGAPSWDALARFVAGECSEAESAAIGAWLTAHPQDRELVKHLSSATAATGGASTSESLERADVDVDAALAAVHRRINTADSPTLTVDRGGGRSWGRRATLALSSLAAAAIIVAYVSVRRGPALSPASDSAPSRLYATGFGQRDSIVLGEGSRIILGPDSRLLVPTDYGLTARSVELLGDAYFEVRHDASKPFSVKVGNALIEDVGTTFTVESDAADTVNVSVLTGSVRLRPATGTRRSGAVLVGGDRGSLMANGAVQAYPHAAVAEDSAWMTGRLVFRDASLARVASEIHRWFGVTMLVVDSSLASRHVTASFNGESADQVLKIVGMTLGARVERKGDSAMVYSNRGPNAPR